MKEFKTTSHKNLKKKKKRNKKRNKDMREQIWYRGDVISMEMCTFFISMASND